MITYHIKKIRDPRTPGFFWYEIEGRDGETGERYQVAICDTRDEAVEMLRAINVETAARR